MWDKETYEEPDQELTYEELGEAVENEMNNISEEERHMRIIQVDPPFLTYIHSLMKPHQKVILNESSKMYTFL